MCIQPKAAVQLCCAVLNYSVVSDCDPMTVARWAPLATGILQARILEWVARPSLLFSYILYRRHHFCRMKTALIGGQLGLRSRKKPTAGAGASGLQCVGMMWLQKSVKLMQPNTLTTLTMKPNNILRKDRII